MFINNIIEIYLYFGKSNVEEWKKYREKKK